MALLRFVCSPSTAYFPNEQQLSLAPFSSSVQNPHFLYKNSHSHLSISCSIPSFFPISGINNSAIPVRAKRHDNFIFQSSSQSVESIPATVSNESTEKIETDNEEFSKTRLIAQNIPWSCTHEDIRSLFEKYGNVLEVELSMYDKTRNRGLAFVEMGSPEEALAAFNNLESYELDGRTIKINYARPKKKNTPSAQQKSAVTFNLFVANLSFEARGKDLREFFKSHGCDVVSAEIMFHENPRRSLGYGFVAFKSKKEAEAALSVCQGKSCMGRPIRIARSKQFVKQLTTESAQTDDTSTDLNSSAKEADAAHKD